MTNPNHEPVRDETNLTAKILPWVAILILLQSVYGFIAIRKLGLAGASNFGEMFGALEVVFSGLGFVGVILTIRTQGQDAVAAQNRQTEHLILLGRQLELLQTEIDLQRKRDEIDAGPFFRLASHEFTGNVLKLSIVNLGAPVICLDLTSANADAQVRRWSPDTLATGDVIEIDTQLKNPQEHQHSFDLLFRDRRGQQRTFRLEINRAVNPARFTFAPVSER